MAKTLTINGTVCTSNITPYGYKVQYEKIEGNNSGRMLDGSYVEDFICRKAIVTLPCMPMDEETVQTFIQNLHSQHYATLVYYDPETAVFKEINATYEETEMTFRGAGATGAQWWTGITLTFTEV